MTRIFCCLMIFLASLLSACSREPKVEVTVTPSYPCVGDDVTFAYSMRHVDRVVVKNRSGTQIHSGSSRNGSFVIRNISRDMLPLSATGTQDDNSETVKIGPGERYPLDVIDAEITTSTIDLTQEVITESDNSAGSVCGCYVYQGQTQTCVEEYPLLAVSTSTDAVWEDLGPLFAQRARVTKVVNRSSERVILEKDGSRFDLAPQASQTVETRLPAKGIWTATLPQPFVEFLGFWVDAPKINNCNATAGWAGSPPLDVSVRKKTAFSLVCDIN